MRFDVGYNQFGSVFISCHFVSLNDFLENKFGIRSIYSSSVCN